MATANICLTEPVVEKELKTYGAGICEVGYTPQGLVVFGIASEALTANSDVYITPDGQVSATTSAGAMKGKILTNASVKDGVWVIIAGFTGSSFVIPSLGTAPSGS